MSRPKFWAGEEGFWEVSLWEEGTSNFSYEGTDLYGGLFPLYPYYILCRLQMYTMYPGKRYNINMCYSHLHISKCGDYLKAFQWG